MKIFCASKDTIRNVRRGSIEWENIFASHVSAKGLQSSIYAIYIISSIQQKDNLNLKWAKEIHASPMKIGKWKISM